ncbi:MAG: hypothetical protein RMJ66_06260 [Bacteroidia bacterium]|nr:hypothetical protein [Bacteroidia bacterium]MDW8134655.1 hypothetical protein [Bacteroidia bacterium]
MSSKVIIIGLCLSLWAQTWQDVGGGVNNLVNVIYPHNGVLYVGGQFSSVGSTNLTAYGIAKYTPSQGWSTVGPGTGAGGTGQVYAITEYQGKIIVGGEFSGIGNSSAQNLAAYDPVTNTWSAVGGGVSGPVYALAVYDGELLVGGGFTQVGNPPQSISYFARWNGSQWLPPDPTQTTQLLMGGVPRAFVEFQNKLYVAGSFIAAYYNQTQYAYLAIWDKSLQQLLPAYTGQGPNNNIWTAAVWNNKLYLGGDFTLAGSATGRLVTYDGFQFGSVPDAPNSGSVRKILPVGNSLFVAGNFTTLGNGTIVNRVAQLFTNGAWSALANGIGPLVVSALAWDNNILFVGGNFTQDGSGSINLSYIAQMGGLGTSLLSHEAVQLVSEAVGTYLVSPTGIESCDLRLVDMAGRLVWEKNASIPPGGKLPIPLPGPGVYILQVQGTTGLLRSFRFYNKES